MNEQESLTALWTYANGLAESIRDLIVVVKTVNERVLEVEKEIAVLGQKYH
jgi:hypothetical protein